MEGLTVGRMVHYVQGHFHWAAVITHVWGDNGTVNLYVFPDGSFLDMVVRTPTSVMFDDTDKKQGTWHWIEKA